MKIEKVAKAIEDDAGQALEGVRQSLKDMEDTHKLFILNDRDFQKFEDILSTPLPENSKLEELMLKPSPWNK